MSKTTGLVAAGFGGQGLLFSGRFIATIAMNQGKEVSWLPSYGPEMKGGTANCSVVISDTSIGSPIVEAPDILIAMTNPAVEKFLPRMVKGSTLFYDSSLVTISVERDGVTAIGVPATKMTNDADLVGLGNMVMVGHFIKAMDFCTEAELPAAMEACIPVRFTDRFDSNMQALAMGLGA